MIKAECVEKDYWRCNACLSDDDIKKIRYGQEDSNLTSLRLCGKCRKEMREVLKDESN